MAIGGSNFVPSIPYIQYCAFEGNTTKGKERESGNQHNGLLAKNGKSTLKNKDLENSLPMVALQSPPRQQCPSVQERKEKGGKPNGEGRRYSKEVVRGEDPPVEKSLLGPGPSQGTAVKKGTKPTVEAPASPSSSLQAASSSSPTSGPVGGTLDGPSASASPSVISFRPPSTTVTMGPNGTKMQVVQVPPQSEGSVRRKDLSSPSAASRTKGKKNSKDRTKKGSPAKLNPSRPLQIWSPMKDKRIKSKTRMAALTLQEINAWIEAAHSTMKRTTTEGGNDVPVSASGHRVSLGDPQSPAV
ncbi:unnamed protein product [Linum trigynum]|uniref:Uncharacterized protein n=1 Tax=Linum trigynum TaxID=586398 RepID=A0AAV2DEF3_9ROSI